MAELEQIQSVGMVRRADHWLLALTGESRPQFMEYKGQVMPEALQELPARQQVAGISASQLQFRRTELPFTRVQQIRQLIPQEVADNALTPKNDPHFAMALQVEDNSSQVSYVVGEKAQLREQLEAAQKSALNPAALVVEELASWPLVSQCGLLNDKRTLLVDCSAEPAAVLLLEGEQLLDFRIVSPAVSNASDPTLLAEELNWLLDTIGAADSVPDTTICLIGEVPEAVASRFADARRLTLAELKLEQWWQLRPLGLAIAAKDRQWVPRLLDFRWGDLAYQPPWRQWLKPWLPAVVLGGVLLSLVAVSFGINYWQLADRERELRDSLQSVFKKALPGTPMVDPVRQLRRAVGGNGDEAGKSLITWLGLVQQQLSPELGVSFERLQYDDNGVQVNGQVTSYAQLDQLQELLKSNSAISNVSLLDAKKVGDEQQVQFRLKLQ